MTYENLRNIGDSIHHYRCSLSNIRIQSNVSSISGSEKSTTGCHQQYEEIDTALVDAIIKLRQIATPPTTTTTEASTFQTKD